MTTEKYYEDFQKARLELSAALAVVMNLVKAGKAFGAEWAKALERENKARQKMHRVLHSPVFTRVEPNPGANQQPCDSPVDVSERK